MVSVALPIGTFLMLKAPLASVMAQNPFSFIRMEANSTGFPFCSSVIRPAIVTVWAIRPTGSKSSSVNSIDSCFFIHLVYNSGCKVTKSREQNKRTCSFFLPRRSNFAILDGKVTNNSSKRQYLFVGMSEKNSHFSFLISHFFCTFAA